MSARLLPVLDVADAIEGREVVGLTIGSREEAIIVLAATRADASIALVVEGEDVSSRDLPGLTECGESPLVQPLPEGEVLVVGRRVYWSAEEFASERLPNAAVYDAHGGLVRQFVLGDGIRDVQATEDGTIWVSYYDEGVFGDDPIAASGLARFDRFGELEWKFEPPSDDLEIWDCYALNVSPGVAWAYYYGAFPLVRISGNEIEWWDVPVKGAEAVAIRGERAWFVGGYENDRVRCVICRFADRELMEDERFFLTTPSGQRMPDTAQVAARGESIYALDGTTLYRA